MNKKKEKAKQERNVNAEASLPEYLQRHQNHLEALAYGHDAFADTPGDRLHAFPPI
jgi:hypothetical protein